jgi:hypothetical protein
MGMVGAGGCIGTQEPEVGLGQVRVQNLRDNPVEFRVSIERDGEDVFEEVVNLDGQEGQTVDGVTITERWMGERVEYAVTVELVGEGLERTFSTRDAEEFIDDWGSHECFGCLFLIEDQMIDHALNPLETCP